MGRVHYKLRHYGLSGSQADGQPARQPALWLQFIFPLAASRGAGIANSIHHSQRAYSWALSANLFIVGAAFQQQHM